MVMMMMMTMMVMVMVMVVMMMMMVVMVMMMMMMIILILILMMMMMTTTSTMLMMRSQCCEKLLKNYKQRVNKKMDYLFLGFELKLELIKEKRLMIMCKLEGFARMLSNMMEIVENN